MDELIDELGLDEEYSRLDHLPLSNNDQCTTLFLDHSDHNRSIDMNGKSENMVFQSTCRNFTFVADSNNKWSLIQNNSKSDEAYDSISSSCKIFNSPISIDYDQYLNDNYLYTNNADGNISCPLPRVINILEGISKCSRWLECDVRRYALLSKLFGAEISDSG
jgi:hypothetical protein